MALQSIKWVNGNVKLVDQTRLPGKLTYITCRDVETLWQAIKRLSVRGAPALGAAGAFGILLGLKECKGAGNGHPRSLQRHVKKIAKYLATSRPTAVNLFYALERMQRVAEDNRDRPAAEIKKRLKKEALAIYEEDRRLCRQIGETGHRLIKSGARVLTVCNTGALATVDYGTALGVVYTAKRKKKDFEVYACESRPLLQGARLTAWELKRARIKTTLICDNTAAALMQQGKIDIILTGADRIAANGDTANKIGTYDLAVAARYHKVPFYVVAPTTTIDRNVKKGDDIPIEQRDKKEVTHFAGVRCAPAGVNAYNPAFDVTPRDLITGIVTEQRLIRAPNAAKVRKLF